MNTKKAQRQMKKRIRKAQFHHITYNPERIVPVFRGEHQVLTLMQRMGYTSAGFLEAITFELTRLRGKPAIILNKIEILNLRAERKQKKNAERKLKKANRKNLLADGKHPRDSSISKESASGSKPARRRRTTRTRVSGTSGLSKGHRDNQKLL